MCSAINQTNKSHNIFFHCKVEVFEREKKKKEWDKQNIKEIYFLSLANDKHEPLYVANFFYIIIIPTDYGIKKKKKFCVSLFLSKKKLNKSQLQLGIFSGLNLIFVSN